MKKWKKIVIFAVIFLLVLTAVFLPLPLKIREKDKVYAVKRAVSIPIIASSGAGCEEHFYEVFTLTDAESALAAGIFHRNEVPIGAVKSYLKGKVEIRHG